MKALVTLSTVLICLDWTWCRPSVPWFQKHHDRGPLCIAGSAIAARGVQAADPRARGSAVVHQRQLFQLSSSFLLLFSANPNLLLATKRQPPAIPMPPSPTSHLSLSCIYGLGWVSPYSVHLCQLLSAKKQYDNFRDATRRREKSPLLKRWLRLREDVPSRRHLHIFTEARLHRAAET